MGTDTNKTMAMIRIVNLKDAIEKLRLTESDSMAITSLCDEYSRKLDEGKHEEEICEQFVVDLSKVAGTEGSKSVLDSVSESIRENKANISLAKDVYSLSSGSTMYVAPVIESSVVRYMLDKNPETRDDVKVAVSLFEGNQSVKSILETLNFESYEEKSGKKLVNAVLKEEFKEKEKRTYTEDEVNAIIENRIAVEKSKMNEIPRKKTLSEMENRINLHGIITNILKENSSNDKLRVFCEKYMKALNEGRSDEVLYESFISGISNWNYLSAVDTELSALNDRVRKYRQEINLKKILEMMKETGSYYIVPLIEDVVVDYAENKNMRTRTLMIQRLESFEYDPFVRDILNIASKDLSVENTVWLGESVELANNYVKSEKIYSPVLYLNENETVFNVRGTYYRRSGDSISKLGKKEVSGISESFRNLCSLVNSSNVSISDELNTITIYGSGRDKAVISESSIMVNGSKVKTSDIDRLASMATMMNETENASFYAAIKVLNENFDSIAHIDFVKRVSSKDNSGLCVDVFKINESIFVNTINEALGKSIFYKNVNPIQCRKYINEHMGINVSPLFEDVLPEQEKAKKDIQEKKEEYESYLKTLQDKREELEKMKDEGSGDKDIDDAIDMIDKEIEDTKNDYKKFQKDADDFLNGKDSDKEEDDKAKPQKDADDDSKGSDDGEEDDEDQAGEDPKESPEDMEQPITDNPEFTDDQEDQVDVPDEYADVPEFDSDFDIAMTIDNEYPEGDEGPKMTVSEDTDGYKVVRVSYNKNVKTGKTSNKGEVIVIIPSVDANGDVHDDMRKITFMLDQDRKPVVNNEYMPLAMYNAIVNAIDTCPETENVSVEGEPDDDPDGNGGGGLPVPQEDSSEVQSDTPVQQDTVEPTDDTVQGDESQESADDVADAIDPAVQETPAETQEKSQGVIYPVKFGIYPEEIAPKDVQSFTKDLDNMKIKHTESESGDGEICLEVANKAQAHALREYFREWMSYNDDQFNSFFPELKECFGKANESYSLEDDAREYAADQMDAVFHYVRNNIDKGYKFRSDKSEFIGKGVDNPALGSDYRKYAGDKFDVKQIKKMDGSIIGLKVEIEPKFDFIKEPVKFIVEYYGNESKYHKGYVFKACGKNGDFVELEQNGTTDSFVKSAYDYYQSIDDIKDAKDVLQGHSNESVSIFGVKAINESKGDRFSVVVPANDTFCKMFGLENDGTFESFNIIAENENEAQEFYNRIYEHSLRNKVDQDIEDILEYYAPKYGKEAERTVRYNLSVPYNGFLESKLESRGFSVNRIDEMMNVDILRSEYGRTKSLLESVYGSDAPESVKDFIDFVNENVIITVKDESTGKTVEIDVDAATSGKNPENSEGNADFESSFKDTTTFDPEKSMLFKDDDESAEDDKNESENDGENEDNEEKEPVEGEEKKDKEEGEEDKEKDKKKSSGDKRFTFKATKKKDKKEDKEEGFKESVNESTAATTVLDIVEIPDGRKGQVISEFADGTLIVNVQGHTLPFERKQLKAVNPRPDNLDFPVKFDPLTLKGVVENYVSCGMFLNNVQITPNDCKVKLLEYVTAKPEDEINIVIEGESTKAAKKFIRITENLNDVLDLANYAGGKMTLNVEGVLTESDVLINIKDYMHYKNVNEETCPVRVLVYDDSGETHLRYINGTQLRLNESSDIYVPEYINDLNRALLLCKPN